VAKASPELVSENIVDLFVAIGDAIKQVCLYTLLVADKLDAVCGS
jgi:hypothetical protein